MDRWRALFEAEHARLWRSLLAHTGDPDVASDAAAEAFAQAVRRGEAVRDPAAWVWRAAFRIAAGQLAVRRRSGRGESPDLLVAAADTLPDDVVVLLDALGRLPEADGAWWCCRSSAACRPPRSAARSAPPPAPCGCGCTAPAGH